MSKLKQELSRKRKGELKLARELQAELQIMQSEMRRSK